MATDGPNEPLPYAVPSPSYGHKVWAGVAITLAGLGLVIIGGCFLIGIMLITNNGFNGMVAKPSNSGMALVGVLYLLAAITFVVAGIVLIKGLTSLFRVLKS
jgi:hypothetical protein